MATNRMKQLQKLANPLQQQQSQFFRGQQQARDIQLQRAVQQAPQTAPSTQVSQQIGAGLARQEGQARVQAAQTGAGQRQFIGQQQMLERRREQSAQLFQKKQEIDRESRRLEQSLSNISRGLKQDVVDRQFSFQEDELGRTAFNNRQLADWAVLSAKSEEEFNDYRQTVQQAAERKMTVYRISQQKIEQELKQQFQLDETRKNQAFILKLQKAKAAINQKIREEQTEAANRAQAWNAIGTIAGLAAGVGLAFATGGASVPLTVALTAGSLGASAGGAIGSGTAAASAGQSSVNVEQELEGQGL